MLKVYIFFKSSLLYLSFFFLLSFLYKKKKRKEKKKKREERGFIIDFLSFLISSAFPLFFPFQIALQSTISNGLV